MTRGPVHEAFAEPVDLNTQPSVVAPTQPPANIVENPPADKPVGDQYVWIPGYWAWDSERNDYIWVSGCWRAAPPGRYWVPGYWSQTGMGWEWVPGFWAQQVSNVQQIEYLPAPPVIADVEPPGPPPTTTISGCRPAGTGIRASMSGETVTGLRPRKDGFGRRRIMYARREVMCSPPGTGITP